MINFPLVSIIVITYNSSGSILQTLESIREQNYKNLELIISDDGSTDDTVEICEKWLEKYKLFVNQEIITVEKNTGVPNNCQRGITKANGEWCKIIAGDDLLLNSCISDNITYVSKNEHSKIVISDMVTFIDGTEVNYSVLPKKPFWITNNLKTADEQYQSLLIAFCGNTPTFFIAKEVLEEVKFDNEIKHMEDYPFILNASRSGYAIVYLEKVTVAYRISPYSASNYHNDKIFNDFYRKNDFFNHKYRYANLSKRRLRFEKSEVAIRNFFNKHNINKRNSMFFFLYRIISKSNPFYWLLNNNERINIL